MKLSNWILMLMPAAMMALSLAACPKSGGGGKNICGDKEGEKTEADCVGEEVFKDENATPACACVCELTQADCAAGETLNAAGCTCDPITDDDDCANAAPVSTDNIIGDTYALTLSADSAQAACGPPTSPLVCTALPMLLTDPVIVGFSTASYDAGTQEITLVGAVLEGVCDEGSTATDCSQAAGATLNLPPVDFSGNPCLSLAQDGVIITISDMEIPVDIELEGQVDEAAGRMLISRFRLNILGSDIEAIAGLDPCAIVPCIDGWVMAEFHGMAAYFIEGLTIVPSE